MLHCDVRKQDRGFTLIEMLITAIIVSVVAAIAAPNFISMYNRYQVEEGMRQIEGAIKEAQRQAMRNSKTCKIKLTTTTVDGETRAFITTVLDTDSGETAGVDYGGCLLSNRTLSSNINTSTTIAGTPTKITFSSKGNTETANEGIIIISHSGTNTQKCVQIEGILGSIISGDYDGTNCNSD